MDRRLPPLHQITACSDECASSPSTLNFHQVVMFIVRRCALKHSASFKAKSSSAVDRIGSSNQRIFQGGSVKVLALPCKREGLNLSSRTHMK